MQPEGYGYVDEGTFSWLVLHNKVNITEMQTNVQCAFWLIWRFVPKTACRQELFFDIFVCKQCSWRKLIKGISYLTLVYTCVSYRSFAEVGSFDLYSQFRSQTFYLGVRWHRRGIVIVFVE